MNLLKVIFLKSDFVDIDIIVNFNAAKDLDQYESFMK